MLNQQSEFDGLDIFKCLPCGETPGIKEVLCTHMGAETYFHIYIHTPDYKLRWVKPGDIEYKYNIDDRMVVNAPYQIQTGKKYRFRLELHNNVTYLCAYYLDGSQNLTILQGFPITPTNAVKKLPTILTFL